MEAVHAELAALLSSPPSAPVDRLLEAVALYETRGGSSCMDDAFVSSVTILASLCAGDTLQARFAWKRASAASKADSKDLRNVWELGKCLWKRDVSAFFKEVATHSWHASIGPLVDRLSVCVRTRFLQLVPKAFSEVSLAYLSEQLGLPVETIATECARLGWLPTATPGFVSPVPVAATKASASDIKLELDSIDRLTVYALSLERKQLVVPPLQSASTGDAGGTTK